jgi:hypothetical protein
MDVLFYIFFFNLFSDQSIYANKVVLCARCSVMAVMFGGKFLESDQSTLAEVKYIVFKWSYCYLLRYKNSNLVEQELLTLPEHMSSHPPSGF